MGFLGWMLVLVGVGASGGTVRLWVLGVERS